MHHIHPSNGDEVVVLSSDLDSFILCLGFGGKLILVYGGKTWHGVDPL